jgi:hypothetical protein
MVNRHVVLLLYCSLLLHNRARWATTTAAMPLCCDQPPCHQQVEPTVPARKAGLHAGPACLRRCCARADCAPPGLGGGGQPPALEGGTRNGHAHGVGFIFMTCACTPGHLATGHRLLAGAHVMGRLGVTWVGEKERGVGGGAGLYMCWGSKSDHCREQACWSGRGEVGEGLRAGARLARRERGGAGAHGAGATSWASWGHCCQKARSPVAPHWSGWAGQEQT